MSRPVVELTLPRSRPPSCCAGGCSTRVAPRSWPSSTAPTDSFFAGNRHADLDSALRALDAAVEQGADIVDVGGVRAGQEGEPVSAAQEIDRVLPFLERARAAYPDLALSLDTWRSEVARAARTGRHRPRQRHVGGARPRARGASPPSWAPVSSCRIPVACRPAPTPSTSATDPTRSTSCATSSRPCGAGPTAALAAGCRGSASSSTPPLTSARPRRTRCRCFATPRTSSRSDFRSYKRCPARISSARVWTCRPTSASREASRRPPSPAGWAPPSSARTTCERPGAPSTWWPRSGAIGPRDWPSGASRREP